MSFYLNIDENVTESPSTATANASLVSEALLLRVLTYLNAAEALFILFDVASSAICFYVVQKHPMFHRNLRMLVASMWIHWLIGMVIRLAMLGWTLYEPRVQLTQEIFVLHGKLRALEYARVFAFATIVHTVGGAVVERSLATIQLKSYEQQRRWTVVVCVMIYAWLAALASLGILWQQGRIPIVLPAVCGVIYTAGVLAIFITVQYINGQRYRQSKQGRSMYTLSQRFQLSENLKSLTVIRRCLYASGVAFVLVSTVVAIDSYLHQTLTAYIAREVVNFTACVFTFVFLITAVTSTSLWTKELFGLLRSFATILPAYRRNSVMPLTPRSRLMSHVYGLDGQRIFFNPKNEQDIYFAQFKQVW